MSMPQPISVALVVSEESRIRRLKRKFRLGMPGIGSAYYCALNSLERHPTQLPTHSIHLWLTMDDESFAVCSKIPRNPDRDFYADRFPNEVVRVNSESQLEEWKKRVEDAYLFTS